MSGPLSLCFPLLCTARVLFFHNEVYLNESHEVKVDYISDFDLSFYTFILLKTEAAPKILLILHLFLYLQKGFYLYHQKNI